MTAAQVVEKKAKYGKNELPDEEPKSIWVRVCPVSHVFPCLSVVMLSYVEA